MGNVVMRLGVVRALDSFLWLTRKKRLKLPSHVWVYPANHTYMILIDTL